MHKTLEELELALAPLIKLIPERKLQAEIIIGYCYGQKAILYWDVLDILSYEVVESEYESDRYFSLIEVQLKYGKVKVNFEDLLIKQLDPKVIIADLLKEIDDQDLKKYGILPYVWHSYIKAKEYLNE